MHSLPAMHHAHTQLSAGWLKRERYNASLVSILCTRFNVKYCVVPTHQQTLKHRIYSGLKYLLRLLGRPTYLSAVLGFTAILFLFFDSYPPRSLNGDSTKTGHMLGRECDLKMHVRNLGYILPYKSGAKAPFSMTSQLNGDFSGLCLRNETRYT